MAKRFTEAQKQAALADLQTGMTLEQASKKHKCSTASLMQWKRNQGGSGKADRLMALEEENKQLKNENQALRSLMLDGYIAKEQHPKLRQIAQALRDAGSDQLQFIMEIILSAQAEVPASGESPDTPSRGGQHRR
jgi:hypothetical protein